MSRLLYFDCFSGISGDMALGAMLDAGLPLEDLKRALGSLAVSGYDVTAPSAFSAPGCRRRSSPCTSMRSTVDGVLRTALSIEHAPSIRVTGTRTPSSSTSVSDLQADRPVRVVAGGPGSREGHVSTAGGGRGRHPPDAGGEGSPPRGRRARLDHRHRRHRVRARMGGRRPHRVLAAQRGRRHGALGARPVSRAGAGDREAARRRTGLRRDRCRKSWSRRPAR